MHWLEALARYLEDLRSQRYSKPVTVATVHTDLAERGPWEAVPVGDDWLIEARPTPRGNIALHLFPSAR